MKINPLIRGILLIVFAIPLLSSAQNPQIVDSLNKRIAEGKEDTLKAKHLNDLVWYIKFSNPDTSLLLLDQSEKLSRKLDFADGLGNSFNNRAIIYTVGGNFDDALKYYKLAIEQFERNRDFEGVGFCFSNMAICYEYQSMFDSALVYNKKALEVREMHDLQKGIAQSNINIGVIYFNKGYYLISLKHYMAALDFYDNKPEKSAIDKSYLGSIQNNIGNIYLEMDDLKLARKYLLAAEETYKDVADKRELAYLYNDLGETEIKLKNITKADDYFIQALKLSEEADDALIKVATLQNLARVNYMENRIDEAAGYVNQGLEASAKISDKKYAIGLYLLQGRINQARQRSFAALKSFNKALTIADSAGIIKQKDEILLMISNWHAEAGHWQKANEYLKLHIAAADSLFNIEKHNQVASLEALYENEKAIRLIEQKESENKLLQQENEINATVIRGKNQFIFSILAGLMLIAAATVMLFIQYRRKNNAYNMLYEKSMAQIRAAEIRRSSEGLKNGELFDQIEQKMQDEHLYRIKDLSQDMVADKLKTNRTYVSQAIIDHSGKRFREYIKEYRVKEAMEILADPKKSQVYSIDAISEMVGFNSIATFNAAFKQFTGLTPSQFRNRAG